MDRREFRRRLIVICTSVLIALSAISLIIICVIFGLSEQVGNMYGIVLDAGSTSTKQNLYRWKDCPFRTNGDVKQIEERRTEPGISSYVDVPQDAYPALKPHLEELIAVIPSNQRPRTPVYLAATAGMRLKILEDPLRSLELFDYLRRGLSTSGLQVETPNERIRLLSGSEEGLYGWVSVNYILGKVTSTRQVIFQQTVGSLDLGGASMQIAFAPSTVPAGFENQVDFYSLNLFGAAYDVYSHSYLCYGKNEFEKRVHGTVVMQSSQTTVNYSHPCLLKGYVSEEYKAGQLFSGPCMSGSYAQRVFGSELASPSGLTTFKFIGTGDVAACVKVIVSQFQINPCTMTPCTFNGVFQPPVTGNFRAYAGFAYFAAYLFPSKTTGISKSEMKTAVDTFCNRTWAEIVKAEPADKLKSIWKYCYDGQYVLQLLSMLGFDENSWRTITFGTKIDGTSVSWALGYMLDQTGYILSEHPRVQMSVVAFAVLCVLFLVILIISIVILALVLGNCLL